MTRRWLVATTLSLSAVVGMGATAPRPRAAAPAKALTPRPGMVRSVSYTEAYRKSPEMGKHLAIKITPPGARGKRGFVLIEAYNYSATTLRAVDLRISLDTEAGEELDANISANNVRPNLSGLTLLKLPEPDKPVSVVKAKIKKMAIFDSHGKRVTLNYYIDVIH